MTTGARTARRAAFPVLSAKLAPPALPGRHIPRPALVERVAGMVGRRLTVVVAPPGFGKTTLLCELLASDARYAHAWVSLDRHDDDPRRLWSHVSRAVATAVGARAPYAEPAALLNAAGRFARPALLVLDDAHLIADDASHELIASIVRHAPGALRVVIAARRDPPLPLARLRACGDLGEVRADDLRLTGEEARALVAGASGAPLSPGDAARLHEKTEGWAAALYLAGLSLRGREDPRAAVDAFAGSNRHIVDYLVDEVLAGEREETTDFLLRTSVLDRLCGPLCDAVLDARGSTERLRLLERSNLLVAPLDDDRLWFRYHPLLRDMLRHRLLEDHPGLAPVLHARAARWYEEQEDPRRALEHSLAARDHGEAARLLRDRWLRIAPPGEGPARDAWLEGLPRSVVIADPGLCLMRAVLEESRGAPPERIEAWLAAAERNAADPVEGLPLGSDSVLMEAALVRAAGGGQDVGRLLASARRAHSLARERSALARAIAGTYLAYWLVFAGLHEEARAHASDVLEMEASRAMPLLGALQHAVASLAAAALGEDAAAGELGTTGVDRLRAHGNEAAPRASVVHLAHGLALARRGALADAGDALRRAVALAQGPALSLERAHALLGLARVHKARGDVGAAAAAAREARRLTSSAADPGALRQLARATRPAAGDVLDEEVSDAEARILRLLSTDLTLRQIGERLYLSVNTVKSHTRSLYRKLDAGSRAEAVERARELRIG